MRTEYKAKYVKVCFDEHVDDKEQCYWATIEFEWGQKSSPLALVFSQTMDQKVLNLVRERMPSKLRCNPDKDVYLEDTWIMVNLTKENKHLSPELIQIVTEVEKEFDTMLKLS